MAYRNIRDISEREALRLKTTPVEIQERLDMIYFKAYIDGDKIIPIKSNDTVISDSDCAINDVYCDIRKYCENQLTDILHVIYERFGKCYLGFFYTPVSKTRSIDYYTLPSGKNAFIFASIYTEDRDRKDARAAEQLLVNEYEIALPTPVIFDSAVLSEHVVDSIASKDVDNVTLAKMIMGYAPTYSGLPIENIEGLVIKCGGVNYNLSINETNLEEDRYIKNLLRDSIFLNFIHTVSGNLGEYRESMDSRSSIPSKISELFVGFMNSTTYFATQSLDVDDLIPPSAGYIGDIGYDYIVPTAQFIVKSNDVYKGVLRMLINEFRYFRGRHYYEARGYSSADIDGIKKTADAIFSK